MIERHAIHKRIGPAALVILLLGLFTLPVFAEYGDVILNHRAEKEGMRPVIYPHWFHRIRFRCKVCHKELGFEMRAGANDITMADIIDGKFCGMCHNGQVAWSVENCDICHSGRKGLQTRIMGGHQTGGPGRW
ncbi:c(7)-type cytochrome triheme domain-containing protein [Sedimenticola sp.]|uniref:c(7)-type cytochrome triheme domain-containing protein n=1 Tax=Sedimenticola sp. TaxID=1940285 RepID=UPI003D0A8AFA